MMFTILILDDERVIRESYRDFFEDYEWNVQTAETAENAIEIIQKEKIDGVIVDIRLPGMNGTEFLLKTAPAHPEIAFIVSTGSYNYDIPYQLRNLPQVYDRVFEKPVTDLKEMENEMIKIIEKCKRRIKK